MKILVVTKWFIRWNGAARITYELSKRFKKNHEICIAAYNDHLDPEWGKEFKIYKLRHKGVFALNELRKIIKDYKPDIIHNQSNSMLWLSSIFLNILTVTTTHSNWPMNWFFSPISFVGGLIQGIPHELEMHLADKVISVSKFQQEKFRNRGIRSEVIYNGIDKSFFQPSEIQVNLKHPCVLFVGSVDSRKAKYLVPVIELLNRKSGKVYTYVIGTPVDKKIVERLKNLDNTHYLGVVDDVKPYYHEADVLVFMSRMEACPLVPIEAQACSLPVVAFDVCSNAEIIKNGESGVLVEMSDLDEMVDKTLKILEDNDLRATIGKNGIKNVKENFLWEDKAEEYLRLLEGMVKKDDA